MSLLQISNSIYIADSVTFIRPFSDKIKNHTKAFHDIESSDISHKCHYSLQYQLHIPLKAK